ncbi:hypothetical protein N5P18_04270 [Janibacter terrae]|uniref:Phosphoserine phosphatase RsbU N-terminal domain-containing protein n=1 Tax=Janibacter terrae TaxID=103817 RepID=A0ABZ2FIF9_9MICO|nr:phosphatase RsbU N-terminal domain-containing protein [Janibacter terrae]MBA4084586.1 hypothetical protein [Kytococcus sp.]HCE60487.1 hypothetical protein [Janibacter terrae]
MSDREPLVRDYRVAFFRYLPHEDEAALAQAYDIGRRALGEGTSVLELAEIHHVVLAEVLTTVPSPDLPRISTAGAAFLMQVLAPFAMTQQDHSDRPDASTPVA